jgi:hypothetical protein
LTNENESEIPRLSVDNDQVFKVMQRNTVFEVSSDLKKKISELEGLLVESGKDKKEILANFTKGETLKKA